MNNGTKKSNHDRMYFINGTTKNGEEFLGMAKKDSYERWMNNGSRLNVGSPQAVRILPSNPGSGVINVVFGPMYILKTPQQMVAIDAATIELLGEITMDDGGCECEPFLDIGRSDVSILFNRYIDGLQKWRAELSGLVVPDNSVMTGSSGTIPFPGGRKDGR